ncbi:MAG: glycosyltransferase family 4 protein [Candidatus Moranbacteria bacterium]|nr:glycosyltransferase family 4 protein [Candidatus Moranbacteria bacterium]
MTIRKKILLVTRPIAPPWDEASKNFAYYLARNISGVEINLLTNGLVPDLPSSVRQRPIYTSNHLSWLQRARLLKLMRIRKDFDIMHFMLTPNKLNAFGFKTFVKNKKARTIQTIATLREDLFQDKDYAEMLFADLIITYSDYAKNKLNSLGFKNVKRVYPGIDLEYYSPQEKDLGILDDLGLTKEDFIVTFAGEYVRLGATDDMVEMVIGQAEKFRERNIKIIFAFRLKNDPAAIAKKEWVVKKFTENKVLDRVVFIDIFSDMAKLYNLSDIVIFPVRNMHGKFDIPLAAVEPMACKKPVIVSDLPILKEFANEKNSITVHAGNIRELADEIFNLQDHPEKRKILGEEGRKFCEENFDIKKVAAVYEKIYEKL